MSFSVPSEPSVREEPPFEEAQPFQDTQVILNGEEVYDIIRKSVLFGVNETDVYSPELLNKWCTNITEECIQRLADLKKPFKYVVFCDVGQNIGNAMHHSFTALWDRLKDRVYSLAWTNPTIVVVVSVFGICTELTRETIA